MKGQQIDLLIRRGIGLLDVLGDLLMQRGLASQRQAFVRDFLGDDV
jgi:hypothetical protein